MAKFAVVLKRALDTTKSVGSVNGASSNARRGYLYYWSIGSESSPADVSIELQMRRCTTQGTGGSTVTPVPIDSGDSIIGATAMQAQTAEPTYTATSDLFREVWNQKYGAKWYAPPGGEIVYPGSAGITSNGFGVLTPVCTTSGTPLVTFECHVDEK